MSKRPILRLPNHKPAEPMDKRLADCIQGGVLSANTVLANWESGDLAGAVRSLAEWADNATVLVAEYDATKAKRGAA